MFMCLLCEVFLDCFIFVAGSFYSIASGFYGDIWLEWCLCVCHCFAHFQALYFTGNYNADLAAAWIFENQDKNLDAEFNEVDLFFLPIFL